MTRVWFWIGICSFLYLQSLYSFAFYLILPTCAYIIIFEPICFSYTFSSTLHPRQSVDGLVSRIFYGVASRLASLLVCCQQSYLPLESLRGHPHIDRRPPLFDKPHSAWPSSPTLNICPHNQAGKVFIPHSPHLSLLASLEGWESAKARISRALWYNPVSRGPCLV